MEKWLTYDKISLIPDEVSTLEHRAEADTSIQFGTAKLSVPLISAPMPDISGHKMTAALAKSGSLGWVHRFQTIADQYAEIDVLTHYHDTGGLLYGVAVSPKDIDIAVAIHKNFGINIICLDTANGASEMVERAIKRLKDLCPDMFIVAGNIASAPTFWKLQEWGADAIRVGVGSGSVCETRTETGIYTPMASLIAKITGRHMEDDSPTIISTYPIGSAGYGGPQYSYPINWGGSIYQVVRPVKTALLIADGGIKSPGDMCKALALGADVVMAGGIFAGTEESPAPTGLFDDEGKTKRYAGAASEAVQKESGRNEIVHVEGRESYVLNQGPVKEVVERYAAGLRSSMSYMNSRTLEEYRRNVKIVEIG